MPRSAAIILADTKFEFGQHAGAEVVLGDQGLTPWIDRRFGLPTPPAG